MTDQEIAIFFLHVRGIYEKFVVADPVTPDGDSPTVVMWRACLADVALPDAIEALVEHGKENKWPPTPAEIRVLDPNKWRRDYANNRHLEPAARLMSGSSDRESSSRPALAD